MARSRKTSRSRSSSPGSFSRRDPKNLLDVHNAKGSKGIRKKFLVGINYMEPADRTPGLPTVCAFAGACKEPCLHFAGNPLYMGGKTNARQNKNRWFHADRADFLDHLNRAVEWLERMAKRWAGEPTKFLRSRGAKPFRGSYTPCVRPNGTSDIAWEKFGLIQNHPHIQFYDYTKNPIRMMDFLRGRMPANYHLTFSMGGTQDHRIPEILAAGGNVTMVFDRKIPVGGSYGGRFLTVDHKGRQRETFIPETRVIDGDEHDMRFLDPQGVIVGLKFKKPTEVDQAKRVADQGVEGFVFDPESWPAHRMNPSSALVGGLPFRYGCGGYNLVVR